MTSQVSEVLSGYREFVLLEPCRSGSEAVQNIQAHHPALVLIDTTLPDMSGFDLIHQLYPVKIPEFIFLAKDASDAVKAFEYFAFDYLVVPFTDERLHLSLVKLKERIYERPDGQLQEKLNALYRYVSKTRVEANHSIEKNGASLIPIKMSGRIYFIQEDEIQYIVASGYYIEVYARGKKHLIRHSLRGITQKLDQRKFLRIHRSVVISLKYLKEVTRQGASEFSAQMEDGASFKISKSYKSEFFDHMGIHS